LSAQISVIVPTLNSEASVPACLGALFEGVGAGLIAELILSDGGSGDATARIAQEAGAMLLTGSASRGAQLRRACALARGQWLLVVHADTVLQPGWAGVVTQHLQASTRPACFRLGFGARGIMPRWVAGWANLRTFLFGLPYGDQGLLIRRADYDRAGGYPDLPLMEDVALVRALGDRPRLLPHRAITGADRYVRNGWLRRGGRNLWALARYLAGADPNDLVDSYRR
jgi:rSAM/selenodomain-associated transferase 2